LGDNKIRKEEKTKLSNSKIKKEKEREANQGQVIHPVAHHRAILLQAIQVKNPRK